MRTLAAITRDPVTKVATLQVISAGPWDIYAGKSAQSIDFGVPVASGTGPGDFPLPGETWLVFSFRQNGEEHLLAERRLPMEGGYNFRDLGGIKGYGGKHTVWGKLFRADDLQHLTENDTAYLASIPITTIADFRTLREREKGPDTLPASVKSALYYPITPGNLNPRKTGSQEYSSLEEFMLAVYRLLVLDPAITGIYRDFFAKVQKDAELPLLFHCSAGKDRTGFATAMILFALGVDEETVFADYEASNVYLGNKYAHLIAADPEYSVFFTVKRAYLEGSLRAIEQEYGTVAKYLTSALAVDMALMRARFLA